jgi:hypothetical protein
LTRSFELTAGNPVRAQVPAFVPFAEAQKIPSVKKIFHDASESEAKSMYAGIIKLRLSRCWGNGNRYLRPSGSEDQGTEEIPWLEAN